MRVKRLWLSALSMLCLVRFVQPNPMIQVMNCLYRKASFAMTWPEAYEELALTGHWAYCSSQTSITKLEQLIMLPISHRRRIGSKIRMSPKFLCHLDQQFMRPDYQNAITPCYVFCLIKCDWNAECTWETPTVIAGDMWHICSIYLGSL